RRLARALRSASDRTARGDDRFQRWSRWLWSLRAACSRLRKRTSRRDRQPQAQSAPACPETTKHSERYHRCGDRIDAQEKRDRKTVALAIRTGSLVRHRPLTKTRNTVSPAEAQLT